MINFLYISSFSAPQVLTLPLPASSIAKEDDPISLTCESDGWPKAEIKWYWDTMQLHHDGDKYSIQTSEERFDNGIIRVKSVLSIDFLSRDEADIYSCKAESVVNSVKSSTELIVGGMVSLITNSMS